MGFQSDRISLILNNEGMEVVKVISEEMTNEQWDIFYDKYSFNPSINDDGKDWISIPFENKKYSLNTIWIKEQEELINRFFENLIGREMFALDWQHDCFTFSPKEHIPFGFEYPDSERNCQVYFPTYYPNGDYHFFYDKDWNYGLLGHPWRKQIIVIGKELIEKFEEHKKDLDITEGLGGF